MQPVLAALQTLADALINKPQTLPQVEQDLAALRSRIGRDEFSTAVTEVLLDAQYSLTLRQTAGMVLKQQLKVDPPTGENAALRALLVRGITTPQPREVVNVLSGIIKDLVPSWGVPLVQVLMQSPLAADTAVLPCVIGIVDSQEPALSQFAEHFYGLIPTTLELLKQGTGGEELLVRLLKVLYEEPTSEEQEDMCRAHAPRYLELLLSSVQDKRIALDALPGTVAYWTPHANMEAAMSQSFELAFEAMRTGTDVQKTTACRFWSEVASHMEIPPQYITPLVTQLLPCLQWSEEALLDDCGVTNEDDAHVAEQEMSHHTSSLSRREEEDAGDEEEEQTDRLVGCSTLRFEAQQCLSVLSEDHGEAAGRVVLSVLQGAAQEDKGWKHREVLLTLLGAVAEGCVETFDQMGATEHLLTTVTGMLQAAPKHALVRDAAYWCIGELGSALIACNEGDDDDDDDDASLPPLVKSACLPVLVQGLRDGNKMCQRTCIAALKGVKSFEGHDVEVVMALLQVAVGGGFQSGNRCRAFEAATVMMRQCRNPSVAVPELVLRFLNGVMQGSQPEAFIRRNDLPSLLFALNESSKFLQQENAQVVGGILQMVYGIIDAVNKLAVASGSLDHGVQASILALDVASSLCDVFPEEFGKHSNIVKQTLSIGLSFTERMGDDPSVATDREHLVHSCASLSADLATTDWSVISDVSADLSKYLVQVVCGGSLRMDYASGYPAMSNACWALGEFFVRVSNDIVANVFQPSFEALVGRCVSILTNEEQYGTAAGSKTVEGVKQNAGILLGRLGFRDMPIASFLNADVVDAWCDAMHSLQDDTLEEKLQGVVGMVRAVLKGQPSPTSLLLLAGTMASWRGASDAAFPPLVQGVLSGVASLEQVLAQAPVPTKISIVFRHYDSRQEGAWTKADANRVASDAQTPGLDEATWKMICKKLHASPVTGLTKQRVSDMYSSGLKSIDPDAARVCSLVLARLRSAVGAA